LEKEIEKAGRWVQFRPQELEQYIVHFRTENELVHSEVFHQWLLENWLSYDEFRQQAAFYLQLQKLTEYIIDPLIPAVFLKRKHEFDEIVLSRIVLSDRIKAEQVLQKIAANQIPFDQAAKQYSIAEDAIVGGAMGLVDKDALPPEITEALNNVQEGQIIGIIPYQATYCILKIHKIVASVLTEDIQADLRDELFEDWLAEKMQEIEVRIQ
jgi:parvulin-like peptidyl-prolyl isomerase